MRRASTVLLLFLLAAASSCAPRDGEVVCTLIGCEDGWAVEVLNGSLPQSYTMRAVVDGQVVASRECSPANPCSGQVFLPGVTAAEADLEIVGADLNLRWTVRPQYGIVQPNGPQCPPTCRQARVQVRL